MGDSVVVDLYDREFLLLVTAHEVYQLLPPGYAGHERDGWTVELLAVL